MKSTGNPHRLPKHRYSTGVMWMYRRSGSIQMTRVGTAFLPKATHQSTSLWSRVAAHLSTYLGAITAAHTRRARLEAVTEADIRDTGLPAEELLGERGHEPALPFFMQRGFGRQ
jgi:hypothetical protein